MKKITINYEYKDGILYEREDDSTLLEVKEDYITQTLIEFKNSGYLKKKSYKQFETKNNRCTYNFYTKNNEHITILISDIYDENNNKKFLNDLRKLTDINNIKKYRIRKGIKVAIVTTAVFVAYKYIVEPAVEKYNDYKAVEIAIEKGRQIVIDNKKPVEPTIDEYDVIGIAEDLVDMIENVRQETLDEDDQNKLINIEYGIIKQLADDGALRKIDGVFVELNRINPNVFPYDNFEDYISSKNVKTNDDGDVSRKEYKEYENIEEERILK